MLKWTLRAAAVLALVAAIAVPVAAPAPEAAPAPVAAVSALAFDPGDPVAKPASPLQRETTVGYPVA